jgi:hypothetical protein
MLFERYLVEAILPPIASREDMRSNPIGWQCNSSTPMMNAGTP